jgi:hypothetical protein
LQTCLAAGLVSSLLAVPLAASDEIARLTFAQLADSIRADFEIMQTIKLYDEGS